MPHLLTDHDLAVARNRMGENIPVPPKPRKRKHDESRDQCALIRWWANECIRHNIPEQLFFSIPNGGWRDPVGAAMLKREGQRNGVSDLMLAVARAPYHGLFIEMKHEAGKLRPEQHQFIVDATKQGYYAVCCYGLEQAKTCVTNYLTDAKSLF